MSMASGRPALPFVTGAARLHPGDLAGLASIGLRSRKLRAALSALGIAIGVAAIVAVPGLSQSSAAALNAEIARLGTNLLTVANGQSLTGGTAELPSVDAASLDLPAVVGTSVTQGSYLNAATAREPVAVLGAAAAQRLGFDRVWPGMRIQVGGLWFYAVGILSPAVLAPEIDSSILIGFPAAEKYLHFDGHPSQIYVRTTPDNQAVTITVDGLLGAQANPENPSEVDVSQPSDALTAQADAAGAFDTLFLGLGAVALLVGAVGVANIMIISVLERRQEIGLRRALGATRGQIRAQFLAEAILLALAGGATGDITGVAATAVYAHARGWAIVIPPRPGPAAWPPPCSSAPLPDSCPPSAPPGCHPPRRSGASDTKAAGLLPCPLARYQSPARPANRSGRGRKPGLLNTTQQVGPALGTALVGLLKCRQAAAPAPSLARPQRSASRCRRRSPEAAWRPARTTSPGASAPRCGMPPGC